MKNFLYALILIPLAATAGDLKITEKTDEFTQEVTLEAKVQVCGSRSPCAQFFLVWFETDPEYVQIIAQQNEAVSTREILFRVDGQIRRYDALNDFTDVEHTRGIGVTFVQSRSIFLVPIDTLRSVYESEDSGIVRLAGINAAADFDFYKKATTFGKKRPHDRLEEFIERVTR